MDFPRDSCNRGRPVPSVALDVRAIISLLGAKPLSDTAVVPIRLLMRTQI